MDHSYRPQRIDAHASRADGPSGPSRSEQHSWLPLVVPAKPYTQPSRTSSLQSYYTLPYSFTPPYAPSPPNAPGPSNAPTPPSAPTPYHSWPSNTSFHSYYSADTSPMSHLSTYSSSTQSSNLSFPFSVTSINSYKSRKNVLYPRRVHPLPVAVASERSVSPDALIWQVRFLCTALLPYAETRLMPAGKVLLQSLGLHGDFSPHVPLRIDEETLCCCQLFIALTHEVLLKDAVSAGKLEGPCKLLHTTFKNILLKLGAFSVPPTRNSDEADQKAPSAGVQALERFSGVLRALCSVMEAFQAALDSVKPAAAKDGALENHHRMALLELSVSTGLTMEQYRKKLDQNIVQTRTQLNSLQQSEKLLSPPTSVIPTIPSIKGVPKAISTIDEGSEAEVEGSSALEHTWSTPSHAGSTQSNSDSGKRSLPRRILRRLLTSSKTSKGA